MNHRWNEIIGGQVNYYQITFNMSKIVAQTLDCDDILNNHIKARRFIGDTNFLYLPIMRAIENSHDPEYRSAIKITTLEKTKKMHK